MAQFDPSNPFASIKSERVWCDNNDFSLRIGHGWINLVADMLDNIGQEMTKYPDARMVIRQIKEKFGGLRFYRRLSDGAPETLREAIDTYYRKAEGLSLITCEQCGVSGVMQFACGEYTVRCNGHAPEKSHGAHPPDASF